MDLTENSVEASSDKSRASIGARRNPETEAAVLDATAAILAESGYAALTMEAVARRSHAGKATLYRWWPSRGHLILSLITRAKRDVEPPATGSLQGDLLVYLSTVFAIWRGDGGQMPLGPLVRILHHEAAQEPAFARAWEEERLLRWVVMDRILEAAAARGELAPRLTIPHARDLAMALPVYLLIIDRLPAPHEVAAVVEDILPALRA